MPTHTGASPQTPECSEVALGTLRAALRIARELQQLHTRGQLHRTLLGSLSAGDISAELPSPTPEAVMFGGAGFDRDRCPPELADVPELLVPASLSESRTILAQANVSMPPERIDVYQWGSWLCRELTGEGVSVYMTSPRAAAKVPPPVRGIVDRALGLAPTERWTRMVDVIEALAPFIEDEGAQDGGETRPEPGSSSADTPVQSVRADVDTTPTGRPVAGATQETAVSKEPLPASADLPFTRLGHYQIVGRIGRGGMGDVYEGFDPQLERRVAIKVLPPELAAEAEFVRRFRAEASAAAQLDHPNIVHIYFIGEDQGHHFFAMQFVEGESLASVLTRRSRLSVDETLALLDQCLSGLETAHDRGLVHRDIKPANILIDRRTGRAIVADFGLVKSLGTSDSRRTATGVIMGTVDYIAPEQARGLPVDARSDLYSVGVLIYRLLSGRLPFQADSPTAMIFQHVYESPLPLCDAAPDVPAALGQVVAKLLAKSPDDRYARAADLRRSLHDIQQGHAVDEEASEAGTLLKQAESLAAPRPAERTGWFGRARDLAQTLFRRHAPEALQQLQNTQQQVDAAVALHERRRKRLQELLREAEQIAADLHEQAQSQRTAAAEFSSQGQEQKAAESLAAAEEVDRQHALQDEQAANLRVSLAKVSATVEQLRAQRNALVARLKVVEARHGRRPPVSRQMLYLGGSFAAIGLFVVIAVIAQRPWGSSKLPTLTPRESAAKTPETAPVVPELSQAGDLRGLATPASVPGAKSAVKFSTGVKCLSVARTSVGERTDFVLGMADGAAVVCHVLQSTVVVSSRFGGDSTGVNAVAIAPDRQRVAVGNRDKMVTIWRIGESKPIRQFPGHSDEIRGLEFSPDGRHLISSGGQIKLWDLEGVQELASVNLPYLGWIQSFDWSPASSQIAFGCRQHGEQSLWIGDPLQPESIYKLDTNKGPVVRAVFAPDRRHVWGVTRDGVRIWDLQESTVQALPMSGGGYVSSGDVSRAAGLAVTLRHLSVMSCEVTAWDMLHETPLGTMTMPHATGTSIGLSSSGNLAVTADDQGLVCIWDMPASLPPVGQLYVDPKGEPVRGVAFSPDGRDVAITRESHIHLVRPLAAKFLRSYSVGDPLTAVGFSPDGQRLLYGSGLMRGAAGLLVLTDDPGQHVHHHFKDLRRVTGHRGEITALQLIDRSRSLLTGARDGLLRLSNLQTEKLVEEWDVGAPVNGLVVLPGETRVVLATDDPKLVVWDLREKQLAAQWEGHQTAVLSISISEDGQRLATAGADGVGHVWDVGTGAVTATMKGHSGRVTSVALTRDGQRVVTGGDDATVRHWQAGDGTPIKTYYGHGGPVRSVAISGDGQRAASGSDDGSVRVWSLEQTAKPTP